ncbi:hypothetical protein [Cohnella phaseoli]|uniref:Uncharacterized protein n=1 Tax=Cohnella phaseoli TaxID=456490 RepID=A0A3D9KD15_9BACL|nr:hypothetical protein [Cohnella phaseoli]RED84030.1 hypothetical protein DFP98_107138 [Cohnella phaseoli]
MGKSSWLLVLVIGILFPIYMTLFPVYPLFFLVMLAFILGLFVMYRKWAYFVNLFLFSYIIIVGIRLEYIHFEFLPQIRDLIYSDPIKVLLSGHIWGPRFMVSYPAVVLSEWLDWDIDTSFTFYGAVLFAAFVLTHVSVGYLYRNVMALAPIVFGITSVMSTIALSALMNGRLIAAFVGLIYIIYIQMSKINSKESFAISDYFAFSVCFFISTVSSGTMMITLLQILMGTFIILKHNKRSYIGLLLFLAFFVILTGPYIMKMINKNISYFGGGFDGIYKMMTHGLGSIMNTHPKLIAIVIVFVLLIMIPAIKIYRYSRDRNPMLLPVILSLPICMFGGLFGVSTALMIIPSIILISSFFFTRLVMTLTGLDVVGTNAQKNY